MKGKWRRLILLFFLWSELIFFYYDQSWSESNFILCLFFQSIRVDASWSDPDWRSELIRSDFCTCLAKMLVCPVPKISHVMTKWCCRASHLGGFILWNNGRRRATHLGRFTPWHYGRLATRLSRFTLWHNRRWASILAGKFTLWHNGRRAKQPGWMHAPGVARIFQRKISMKALSEVKFYSGCKLSAHFWKMNALEDSLNTDR